MFDIIPTPDALELDPAEGFALFAQCLREQFAQAAREQQQRARLIEVLNMPLDVALAQR